MERRLNCIMLVEDCEADNYLHRKVIEDIGAANDIVIAKSGDEALKRINENRSDGRSQPELIFLDINTPGMEGWDFVDEFDKFDPRTKSETVIVMLTGSLNPEDEDRAETVPLIREFRRKPLSRAALREILSRHFS